MPDYFVSDMFIINKLVWDTHWKAAGIANAGKQIGFVNKYTISYVSVHRSFFIPLWGVIFKNIFKFTEYEDYNFVWGIQNTQSLSYIKQ